MSGREQQKPMNTEPQTTKSTNECEEERVKTQSHKSRLFSKLMPVSVAAAALVATPFLPVESSTLDAILANAPHMASSIVDAAGQNTIPDPLVLSTSTNDDNMMVQHGSHSSHSSHSSHHSHHSHHSHAGFI